jgi:hypothetical protein
VQGGKISVLLLSKQTIFKEKLAAYVLKLPILLSDMEIIIIVHNNV